MKHLHIMNDDKFIEPYIRLIEEYFNFREHKFIILSKNSNNYYDKKENIFQYRSKKDFFKLMKDIYSAENIFLHSLLRKVIIVFFFNPWFLRKAKWILWGGELYSYKKYVKKTKLKSRIYEYMRSYVIKNVEGIITYIKGDFDLAKTWYNTDAVFYECIIYLSNIPSYNISKTNLNINNNYSKEHIFIQVGNSADPSNNHVEILDKIKKNITQKNKIKIICPLSYGKEKEAEKVIKYGKKEFGKDFVPLTEFMDLKTYNKLQSNIDIAIFNHKRQQAMGNILTLLYLGKKVYIRDDIVTWDFMQGNKLKVFSFNNLKEDLFKKIDAHIAKENRKKINSRFNIETFIEEWRNIFNS
ncbi:MAG: TDP-N-acetylfucosamine:lipid II N-acetylfucosaminyltransferase [Bacillota bacterium]